MIIVRKGLQGSRLRVALKHVGLRFAGRLLDDCFVLDRGSVEFRFRVGIRYWDLLLLSWVPQLTPSYLPASNLIKLIYGHLRLM